jgi:hypothetical protein
MVLWYHVKAKIELITHIYDVVLMLIYMTLQIVIKIRFLNKM